MERREFLAGLAATAAVAAATQVIGEREARSDSAEMHPARYAALAQTSAHCVVAGDGCLRHCFGMLAMNDSSMAGCIRAAYDMVAVCGALQSLAATNSDHVVALARAAIEACGTCQKQCEKYPDVPECKACAEACANNIQECKKVLG